MSGGNSKICKDGASKSNDDGICEVNDKLQNMSTDNVSVCANCGKEGDDVNNICNKCKKVEYCNASCKKKHRHKHKKDCEEHTRLATERAAELHDKELFKQPPSEFGDCPICFLRLPTLVSGRRYYECCGKMMCSGCSYAPRYDDQGNEVDNNKCPFCRTPHHTSNEEMVKGMMNRVEACDPIAIYNIGCYHREETNGHPQDYTKALELFQRAAELGYPMAYGNIGVIYDNGEGVKVDEKKAKHYYEVAAMGGNVMARYNLGNMEEKAGNIDRALKHYMIATKDGDSESLDVIKELYTNGHATEEDYTKALQSYQVYLGEIKSRQRDQAAAANSEDCRYID